MKTILSQIEAATMLARDWHYNASGLSFYAEHLLADKVAEIGDHSDKLIETYYLGERETVPPTAGDITREAVEIYGRADGDGIPSRLKSVLKLLAAHCEEIARTSISIGTKSLLDSLCADAYQYVGLIERTVAR